MGVHSQACIDRCRNHKDRYLWGGDECSSEKCSEICNTCSSDRCLWVPQYSNSGDKCDGFTNEISCNYQDGCKYDPLELKCESIPEKVERLTDEHPPKQLISVIPVKNSLTVVWKSKENKSNPNTGFLLRYFKTFKPYEGLKLKYIEKLKSDKYNIELDELDNEEYSISVSAIKKGL